MIINVGESGGGIIVQSALTDGEPVGDVTMMWVDIDHYGITKYWDENANNGEKHLFYVCLQSLL